MASSDAAGGRRLVVPNGAGFALGSTTGVEVLMPSDVSNIMAGLARLEARVDGLASRIDGDLRHLEGRVGRIETNMGRVVWMVLAAVMTALLGTVVSAGVLGG